MTNKPEYAFTSEEILSEKVHSGIRKLWDKRDETYIDGKNGKKIYCVSFKSEQHQKAVFVVNGRVESVIKYQELFYDLFQNGYNVYAFDHRGQGFSDRTISNAQIGHVEEFSDYIEDMAQVIKYFNLNEYRKSYLLAHSMGGAVSTRFLQSGLPHNFAAFAVSAPMYGVIMPWYMRLVSMPYCILRSLLNSEPQYATSHHEYHPRPFEVNALTHSSLRYTLFRNLYEIHPKIKLGGPSFRWVWKSLTAAKKCIEETEKVTLPLLLLQASKDQIVNNHSQNKFMQNLQRSNPNASLVNVRGAKHEILFEKDEYRNPALTKILEFFAKY